jgi:hypothetical protein
MDSVLLWAVFVLVVGQATATGVMWFRIGILTKSVEKACPFGRCPLYERAKHEAAPSRDSTEPAS